MLLLGICVRVASLLMAMAVAILVINARSCWPPQFFDQDGSGAIDTKELGNIMRKLGAKLSDAEIKLLVDEADVNGDGQVDIHEVRAIEFFLTSTS